MRAKLYASAMLALASGLLGILPSAAAQGKRANLTVRAVVVPSTELVVVDDHGTAHAQDGLNAATTAIVIEDVCAPKTIRTRVAVCNAPVQDGYKLFVTLDDSRPAGQVSIDGTTLVAGKPLLLSAGASEQSHEVRSGACGVPVRLIFTSTASAPASGHGR